MDEFEHFGHWWFPGFPKAQIPGRLKFSHEHGLQLHVWGIDWLEVIGNLWGEATDSGRVLPKEFEPELIHGTLEDDTQITLFKGIGNTDRRAMDLSFVMAIFGKHYENSSKLRFQYLTIELELPERWLGKAAFIQSGYGKETTRPNIPVRYVENDAWVLTLAWELKESHELERLTFEAKLKISVAFTEPLTPEAITKFTHHLRRFFMLATGKPTPSKVLRAIDTEEQMPEHQWLFSRGGVFLTFWEQGSSSKNVESRNPLLFEYNDIEKDIVQALTKWFELKTKLEPILTLYLSHTLRPAMYGEFAFLTMAQAVEAFQRRIYGGTYVDPEEFSALRTQVIEQLESANDILRKRFTDSLSFANEYTFNDRLLDLFKRFPPEVTEILDSYLPNKTKFIQKVKASRNYYTHYAIPDLKDRKNHKQAKYVAKEGIQLFGLTAKLKILLHASLLLILEIPAKDIAAIMHKHRLYYIRENRFDY